MKKEEMESDKLYVYVPFGLNNMKEDRLISTSRGIIKHLEENKSIYQAMSEYIRDKTGVTGEINPFDDVYLFTDFLGQCVKDSISKTNVVWKYRPQPYGNGPFHTKDCGSPQAIPVTCDMKPVSGQK